MSPEEKSCWIAGLLAVITYGAYLIVILSRAGDNALDEVSYVSPLLWAIGASIIASGVLHTFFAQPMEKRDQRDKQIYRVGEYAGHWVLVAGAVASMGFAMAELDQFWIANVIYLAFVLSAITSAVVRVAAYRRGFQPW